MEDKNAQEVLNQDITSIADAWRNMSSGERKALEQNFKASGDRTKAISETLKQWDAEFGSPRKVIEISSDRDVFNALKGIYDKTGDWEMVAKVARYNNIPKETMDKFIKDDKFVDSLPVRGEDKAGALARGAVGSLYGGLLNDLTGGKYAEKYVDEVPEGIDYADSAKSHFKAGIRQAQAHGRALSQSNPNQELVGNLLGAVAPIGGISKGLQGVKLFNEGTKLAKAGNFLGREFATGAIYGAPQAFEEETLEDALLKPLDVGKDFAIAGGLLGGAGKVVGTAGRFIGKGTKVISAPKENITKAFEKLKPLTEMSESDIKRIGAKEGWFKDGQINVTEYLAKQHGMKSTGTMTELAKVAKNNREVYNKLKDEVKFFDYKKALDKAAEDAVISNAPLSRVNKLLKSLPEKLEKFTDDIIGFSEEEGVRLADKMTAFNDFVKHELRSIKNPNSFEKQAIEKYLKDVEAANMKQFMKSKLPSELDAIDKAKTLVGEGLKNLSIVGMGPLIKSPIRVVQDKIERNYIRQLMEGKKYREKSPVMRLLQNIGRGADMEVNTEKLRMPARVTAAQVSRTSKKD